MKSKCLGGLGHSLVITIGTPQTSQQMVSKSKFGLMGAGVDLGIMNPCIESHPNGGVRRHVSLVGNGGARCK